MSSARLLRDDQVLFRDSVPRCRQEHFQTYVGVHRQPRQADERGAVHVVECIAGGRLAFFADQKPWFRVVELP